MGVVHLQKRKVQIQAAPTESPTAASEDKCTGKGKKACGRVKVGKEQSMHV